MDSEEIKVATIATEVRKADELQLAAEDNPEDLVTAIRWAAQEVRTAAYLSHSKTLSAAHLLAERADLSAAA